jgi:hypothetical protein
MIKYIVLTRDDGRFLDNNSAAALPLVVIAVSSEITVLTQTILNVMIVREGRRGVSGDSSAPSSPRGDPIELGATGGPPRTYLSLSTRAGSTIMNCPTSLSLPIAAAQRHRLLSRSRAPGGAPPRDSRPPRRPRRGSALRASPGRPYPDGRSGEQLEQTLHRMGPTTRA